MDAEGRAAADDAGCVDCPSVQVDQLLNDREPDARTFEAPVGSRLDLLESTEDARKIALRDADAFVLDRKHELVLGDVELEANASLLTGELARVGEQVDQRA